MTPNVFFLSISRNGSSIGERGWSEHRCCQQPNGPNCAAAPTAAAEAGPNAAAAAEHQTERQSNIRHERPIAGGGRRHEHTRFIGITAND